MALWAITYNSIKLLLRSKAPLALLLIAVIVVPVSSFFVFTGDGTLAGVIKIMITFNQYVIGAIMMILTLYLSATVLDSELRDEQIALTSSKPVARWKILFGKWLAVAIITGILLGVSAIGSYYAVMQRTNISQVIKIRKESPDTLNYTPQNFMDDAKNEITLAKNQVVTAMRPFRPELLPLENELDTAMARLKASGLPADKMPSKAELRMIINRQRVKKTFPIPFGAGREFYFKNLPQATELLKVRYTLNGSRRPDDLGWLQARWLFSADDKTAPVAHDTDSRSGTTRDFNIPGNLISSDGNLKIVIVNISGPTKSAPPAILEVPMYTGINILAPSSTFAMNYFKATILSWFRLIMIAAIGVGATAFMSGSVTAFLLFSLILVGLLNSFVADTVTPKQSLYRVSPEDNSFSKHIAATMLQILPDFEQTSPVTPLTTGTAISWDFLFRQFIYDVLLRGGIFFLIGVWAFKRREIGIPRIYR